MSPKEGRRKGFGFRSSIYPLAINVLICEMGTIMVPIVTKLCESTEKINGKVPCKCKALSAFFNHKWENYGSEELTAPPKALMLKSGTTRIAEVTLLPWRCPDHWPHPQKFRPHLRHPGPALISPKCLGHSFYSAGAACFKVPFLSSPTFCYWEKIR